MSSIGRGYAVFNRISEAWEIYDDNTIPGLGEGGEDEYWWTPQYDPVNDIIFSRKN